MKTFTKGQQLTARSICDHNCIFRAEVIKRTAKFLTLKVEGYREERRVKITERDNSEICYPLGKYSMAPVFKA